MLWELNCNLLFGLKRVWSDVTEVKKAMKMIFFFALSPGEKMVEWGFMGAQAFCECGMTVISF